MKFASAESVLTLPETYTPSIEVIDALAQDDAEMPDVEIDRFYVDPKGNAYGEAPGGVFYRWINLENPNLMDDAFAALLGGVRELLPFHASDSDVFEACGGDPLNTTAEEIAEIVRNMNA